MKTTLLKSICLILILAAAGCDVGVGGRNIEESVAPIQPLGGSEWTASDWSAALSSARLFYQEANESKTLSLGGQTVQCILSEPERRQDLLGVYTISQILNPGKCGIEFLHQIEIVKNRTELTSITDMQLTYLNRELVTQFGWQSFSVNETKREFYGGFGIEVGSEILDETTVRKEVYQMESGEEFEIQSEIKVFLERLERQKTVYSYILKSTEEKVSGQIALEYNLQSNEISYTYLINEIEVELADFLEIFGTLVE
ncbi:MAG: hypothetical protein AB8E15_01565 [Bdellovibrionales bacterium]